MIPPIDWTRDDITPPGNADVPSYDEQGRAANAAGEPTPFAGPAPRFEGDTDPTPRAARRGATRGRAIAPDPPPDIAARYFGDDEQAPEGVLASAVARSAIVAAWASPTLDMLTDPPPARRWLLRHPTKDGAPCAPGRGDGLLPMGKTALLVADGGVGKTMALIDLSICTITGRKWLGHFEIGHDARAGRVLLALAEEDNEEVRRRLYDAARAHNLTSDEQARVIERLVVLPLAGCPVSLLHFGRDGRTLVESVELEALRQKLRAEAGEAGWSLVALDPLSRWAPDDAETNNAAATRTMQAVETLLKVPGNPTVIVAHHTSMQGAKAGTPQARGVTGIRNGARWEAALRAEGGDVFFKQTKSNYSRPMLDESRLVRGPGGLLRVPSAEEQREHEERAEERKAAREDERASRRVESKEARIRAAEAAIIAAISAATVPLTAQRDVVALVKGENAIKQDAFKRLATAGKITTEGEGRERHYVIAGG